jgi:hypothetical protein
MSNPSATIVVQLTDNTVALLDASGKVTPLGKVPGQLSPAPYHAAYISPTLYAVAVGLPPGAFAVSRSSTHELAFMGSNVSGLAAWSGGGQTLLAWGTYTLTDASATASIFISNADGSATHPVVTETAQAMLPNLVPIRWTDDGRQLYFSSEQTGQGGYILFGGFSSLYRLDVASGMTTTLIEKNQVGMVCLDDLSADASKVVHHCGDKAIGVLDPRTQQSTTIAIPATLTDAAALGSAHLNPAGTRVAFALARRNPDAEQGWLAVSAGLSGESTLLVTSEPGEYLSVMGWLDENTILFQRSAMGGSSNAPDTIWTVRVDGGQAKQIGAGHVLMIARN